MRFEGLAGALAAERFVREVLEIIDQAGAFPELGRVVPEFGSDRIRERFVAHYRVLYRILPDDIEVIGIVHGAMDLRSDPASDN